jgi:hypothetical protein
MDDWTDGQRMDDGTDDGTHGFRGGFILPLLYRIMCGSTREGCNKADCVIVEKQACR